MATKKKVAPRGGATSKVTNKKPANQQDAKLVRALVWLFTALSLLFAALSYRLYI